MTRARESKCTGRSKQFTQLLCVSVASCLVAACGGSLRAPAHGGHPVHLVRSSHFDVYSDASFERAEQLASELERSFFVLENIGFPYQPVMRRRTEIIEFSAEADLAFLGEADFAGFHGSLWEPYTGSTMTVFAGVQSEFGMLTAIHELTHAFVGHHLPNAPTWLNEGLAEYYATMEFSGQTVTLGQHFLTPYSNSRPSARLVLTVRPEHVLGLHQLRSLSAEQFYGVDQGINYRSAWTAVSALWSSQWRPQFVAYLDALQAGRMSIEQAFTQALQGIDEKRLRDAQVDVLTGKELELRTVTLLNLPPSSTSQDVVLSDAETLALYARAVASHDRARALALAEQAVAADGTSSEALMVLGLLRARDPDLRGQAPQPLLASFQNASAETRARYAAAALSVLKLQNRMPELESMARYLVKHAVSAEQFEALSSYLTYVGRNRAALRFARKAVELAPGRPSGQEQLALVLAQLHEYEAALKLQNLAVQLSGHGVQAAQLARLERYRDLAEQSRREQN